MLFCVIQYTDFQKQSIGGVLKVLGKPLKNILDKVHFIVNLYSFALPPCSPPDKPFLPPGKSFSRFLAEQLPKLSLPLDTLTIALMCLSSPVLSNSYVNQKTSSLRSYSFYARGVSFHCFSAPFSYCSLFFGDISNPRFQLPPFSFKNNIKYTSF